MGVAKMIEKDDKIKQDFVIKSFSDEETLRLYSNDTFNIGLWESEKLFITKYFPKEGKILDIGCGAGRTTIGLYKLGYENTMGVDLTPSMIEEAIKNSNKAGIKVDFQIGDACNLSFEDESFDSCLFSFNGIMQIPVKDNRIGALKEIHRVLKKDGIFIFTTHDREEGIEWKWFWDEESERWSKGEQDQRIFEYGDRIIEDRGRLMFLHFPDRKEVLGCLKESGLELVEEVWLSELVEEPEVVRKRVSNCKFWVAKKK